MPGTKVPVVDGMSLVGAGLAFLLNVQLNWNLLNLESFFFFAVARHCPAD